MEPIPVGILGATGVVGQQYVQRLANHPWFRISFLSASERSAGRCYEEAVAGRWMGIEEIPAYVRRLPVSSLDAIDQAANSCALVFSAVGTEQAKHFEQRYAQAGVGVVSNASYHRTDDDVPMVIPEINADHLDIIPVQRKRRGWTKGFIATKCNCSLQSYLIPLFPLHQLFGIEACFVTTLQAISGAGYPGVPALSIADNVIPFIGGEEEKSEKEPLKIFGHIADDRIISDGGLRITAHCNRVPVYDGHLACVSVKLRQKATQDEILQAWTSFRGVPQLLKLPSAPEIPILYREEKDRPQPRLDRDAQDGMAVTVGRLRTCPLLDYRFVGLSHNAVRGAAGGAILIAELLIKQQLI